MFIVMHCGGLPFNGETVGTKSLGGSESAAYYAAKALADKGHSVTLFTNSQDVGTFDGVKYEWAGNLSDDQPLGDRFAFYAENTPHDLCIIQRHPRAFERKLASKQNFWWLHDLALLRNKAQVIGQMWNVDRVLVVSEYHKNQVNEIYGIPKDFITVINNAIDHDLFECEPSPMPEFVKGKALVYSSRPERGLVNLVKAGGIMEQIGDQAHLFVCGYENTTPAMEEFYNFLWARCEELPNVTNVGSLTKSQLAQLMKSCDALVYPTDFEEVSCITAMEAMASGIGIISSDHAALPETCSGSNAVLLPLKDGQVDCELFANVLKDRLDTIKGSSAKANRERAAHFTWGRSAQAIIEESIRIFAQAAHPVSLAHHFIRHSDIKAFEAVKLEPSIAQTMTGNLLREYNIGYKFYRENTYAKHYADFYQYEKDRGVNYGPEDVTGTTRFQAVANMVGRLPDGSTVLDYGCAHGHYTVALAHRHPSLTFIGADLAQSNVDKAREWAASEGLENVTFIKVDGVESIDIDADLIIAAEVIEHVGDPQYYVDTLASHLREGGTMVITTPYGPWEAQGYREHKFWRAHLHHFERADLIEMLGHHPEFKVLAAPSGQSIFASPLGSYIISFKKPITICRPIDYARKIRQTMPDATISCCMIVKDASSDITRALKSAMPFVQEFVIAVDEETRDDTRAVIGHLETMNPLVNFHVFKAESPLDIGFDEARNATLAHASGDFILWLDSDEVLVNGQAMARYIRNSMYNGFAIKQHHFSHDPVGIIKTDLPCRLFRNRKGVKFFGVVHEHPEMEVNKGVGPVMLMPQTEIVHHGYHDERTRRGRFDRNLPLLKLDREKNPSRVLGKFLWLRDLAQSCQYDMESGAMDEKVFLSRAEEGIALWLDLVEDKNFRLVIEALPFYSQLAAIKGGGLDFSFKVDASEHGESNAEKQSMVSGYFSCKEHALKLMNALAEDRMANFGSKYQ